MAPQNTHESTWSNVAQRIEDSVVVLTGVSSYVASKFGLRGFSEALQQELALDREARPSGVCSIQPPSVDTPIFMHAARDTGRAPKPVPLIIDPDRVVARSCARSSAPGCGASSAGGAASSSCGHALAPGLFTRLAPARGNWRRRA